MSAFRDRVGPIWLRRRVKALRSYVGEAFALCVLISEERVTVAEARQWLPKSSLSLLRCMFDDEVTSLRAGVLTFGQLRADDVLVVTKTGGRLARAASDVVTICQVDEGYRAAKKAKI